MARELPKVYEPQQVESKIYDMWQQGGYFHAEVDESKKPFTIVMPPPNVTGQLHMGHAMDATLQDTLIRFKRMQGYNSLWIPGVDHAGIATQIKVEEELRKEGLTRYDLGREKFLERVWDWKHKYGNRIVEQQKKLGASCDWERARFTMDEGCSTRPDALSTGVPPASPPCPTLRWSMWTSPATCGTSATRWPTAPAR